MSPPTGISHAPKAPLERSIRGRPGLGPGGRPLAGAPGLATLRRPNREELMVVVKADRLADLEELITEEKDTQVTIEYTPQQEDLPGIEGNG